MAIDFTTIGPELDAQEIETFGGFTCANAIRHLQNDEEVRRRIWDKGVLFKLDDNDIVDQDGDTAVIDSEDIMANDWEVVAKPLGDGSPSAQSQVANQTPTPTPAPTGPVTLTEQHFVNNPSLAGKFEVGQEVDAGELDK